MKSRVSASFLAIVPLVLLMTSSNLAAVSSESPGASLIKLLLGKEVKALIQLPATKEGINVYFVPAPGKRTDERGVDLGGLTKWLRSRGVGVDTSEEAAITDIKIDRDRVEIHLGGGGEGRRGSKHAAKLSPGFKRAGGSRINFRYQRDIADGDLQPEAFLKFMARVLDVNQIRAQLLAEQLPPELKNAVAERIAKEGMTYQMVLMAFGEAEQKKVNDSDGGNFSETWYYLRESHRWVLTFSNGKLNKIQAF